MPGLGSLILGWDSSTDCKEGEDEDRRADCCDNKDEVAPAHDGRENGTHGAEGRGWNSQRAGALLAWRCAEVGGFMWEKSVAIGARAGQHRRIGEYTGVVASLGRVNYRHSEPG